MTKSRVPSPPGLVRPWLTADARRWAATRPPWWARPVLAAPVLVLALVVVLALSPDDVCTPQAPCGEQWWDAVGTMLLVPHLAGLFVLPELAVLTGPVLLFYGAGPAQWQGGTGEKVADGVMIAALCWTSAVAGARLLGRRRQARLVREAAGGLTGRAPRPADRDAASRGPIRIVLGALLCAAAAGVLGSVVLDDRATDRSARTATVHDVPVVAYSRDDYLLTVRLPDGHRHRFDVIGDYTGARTVRVRLRDERDGTWVQLAAEPYGDHFVRQALGLGLAGLGLVSLASGLLARHRMAALRHGPVPVLRVRVRGHEGRTEVFAFDDPEYARPVLHYVPSTGVPAPAGPAVLYGAVSKGGAVVLSGAGPDGMPFVEASLPPIRPGAVETPAQPAGSGDADDDTGAWDPDGPVTGREAEHRLAAEVRVGHALATLPPGGVPVRWHAGPVARGVGVLQLLAVAAVVAVAWWHGFVWHVVVAMGFGAAVWLVYLTSLMFWRITADMDGLRIGTLGRGRTVPWALVSGAHRTRRGELIVTRAGGLPPLSLGTVGSPTLERRFRRPGRATIAAAQITAMARDPRLRPALRA